MVAKESLEYVSIPRSYPFLESAEVQHAISARRNFTLRVLGPIQPTRKQYIKAAREAPQWMRM
jgi:hypothetical protein